MSYFSIAEWAEGKRSGCCGRWFSFLAYGDFWKYGRNAENRGQAQSYSEYFSQDFCDRD